MYALLLFVPPTGWSWESGGSTHWVRIRLSTEADNAHPDDIDRSRRHPPERHMQQLSTYADTLKQPQQSAQADCWTNRTARTRQQLSTYADTLKPLPLSTEADNRDHPRMELRAQTPRITAGPAPMLPPHAALPRSIPNAQRLRWPATIRGEGETAPIDRTDRAGCPANGTENEDAPPPSSH